MGNGLPINRISAVARANSNAFPQAVELATEVTKKLRDIFGDSFTHVQPEQLRQVRQGYAVQTDVQGQNAVKLIDMLLRNLPAQASAQGRLPGDAESADTARPDDPSAVGPSVGSEPVPEQSLKGLTRERIVELLALASGKAGTQVESEPPVVRFASDWQLIAERFGALTPSLVAPQAPAPAPPRSAEILADYAHGLAERPLGNPAAELVAALNAGGIPVTKEGVESSYQMCRLARAVGPQSLPWLLVSDFGLGQDISTIVAGWALSAPSALAIAEVAAKAAPPKERESVLAGLLRNPSVPEAQKAQLFLALCTGSPTPLLLAPMAVSRPPAPSALVKAALESDAPMARRCLAVALDAGLWGLGKLPQKELRETVDRLLADPELSVQMLAARLFWKGSDISPAAQTRLLSCSKDPSQVNAALSWIQEADSLTRPVFDLGPMNVSQETRYRSLGSPAPLLENLLAHTPPHADATPLFEAIDNDFHLREQVGLHPLAIKAVVEGPYDLRTKGEWIERLSAGAHYSDLTAVLDQVLPFFLAHPEAAEFMPRQMRQIAFLGATKDGKQVLDVDDLVERLSHPRSMPGAIEEILETTSTPVLARPFMKVSRTLRLTAQASILETLRASPNAQWGTAAQFEAAIQAGAAPIELCDILTAMAGPRLPPALCLDWLCAAAVLCKHPRLGREQLLSVLTIVAEAYRKQAGYDNGNQRGHDTYLSLMSRFVDPRLTPQDSAMLINALLEGAPPGVGDTAVRTFEQLGLPKETVRALNEAYKLGLVSSATVESSTPTASELTQMLAQTDRVALLEAALATEPARERPLADAVREFLQQDPEGMLVAARYGRPLGADSARALLNELPALDEWKLLRLITAPDFPSLSSDEVARVWQLFAGNTKMEVELLRFLSAIARGASYDALRAEFGGTLPLGFDVADEKRAQAGEAEALAALLSCTNGVLLDSIRHPCIYAAALATSLPTEVRSKIVCEGIRRDSSLLVALGMWRGSDGYSAVMQAATRVAEQQRAGRMDKIERETANVAPCIVDPRLPKDEARRLLLTFVCATTPRRRPDLVPALVKEALNGTRSALALLSYALAQRSDWTVEDRALLEKAGHLLVEETLEVCDRISLTKRLVAAFEKASSSEGSGAAWGSGPPCNSQVLFNLKNGYEAVLPVSGYELKGDPWETATSFWVRKPYDSKYFGPVPLG